VSDLCGLCGLAVKNYSGASSGEILVVTKSFALFLYLFAAIIFFDLCEALAATQPFILQFHCVA